MAHGFEGALSPQTWASLWFGGFGAGSPGIRCLSSSELLFAWPLPPAGRNSRTWLSLASLDWPVRTESLESVIR